VGVTSHDINAHADVVPIAPYLVEYLREALDESLSDLVFPWPDGSMRSPECDPEKVLRRALAGGGLVDGYDHSRICAMP
jgi:hypothetical protein